MHYVFNKMHNLSLDFDSYTYLEEQNSAEHFIINVHVPCVLFTLSINCLRHLVGASQTCLALSFLFVCLCVRERENSVRTKRW